MIKSILGSKKGSALPLVIILMSILTILGVTFLNIGLFEVKQAVNQEKRLQAYYLAWSGADATASWIINNNTTGGLIGKTSNWTQLPNVGKGRFRVSISGNTEHIRILSTGEVDGVRETAVLQLTNVGGGPPTPIDEVADVVTLGGWLNGSSQIITGAVRSSDRPVRFYPNNGKDTVRATPNTMANFTAPAMYFDVEVVIEKKNDNQTTSINLRADTIVFRRQVTLEHVRTLSLFAPNGRDGSTLAAGRPGTKYGRVYFVEGVRDERNRVVVPPGGYYFPSGFTLIGDELKSPAHGGLITLSGYRKTWK